MKSMLHSGPTVRLKSDSSHFPVTHRSRSFHMQTVHAMASVRLGSGVNPSDIRWTPRGYYFVRDHDDVAFTSVSGNDVNVALSNP